MVTPEAENGEDPQLQTVVTLAGCGSSSQRCPLFPSCWTGRSGRA